MKLRPSSVWQRLHSRLMPDYNRKATAYWWAALLAGGHAPRQLVSGAGHDAMTMAALCPTAMLFIRCRGGVSHNPAEFVTVADSAAALDVMLRFVRMLADEFTR